MVAKTIDIGLTGKFKLASSMSKNPRNTPTTRIKEAAELCLKFMLNFFGEYPGANGPLCLSSELDEATLLAKHNLTNSAVSCFQHKDTFMSFIQLPTEDLKREVLVVYRDLCGKFAWHFALNHFIVDVNYPPPEESQDDEPEKITPEEQ